MFERILTTEQLAALGKVVAESARLEPTLDTILRHITKLSATQYRAFTQGSMLAKKLELLRVIGAELLRSKLQRKRLNALLDKLASINSERVIVVHGQWKETLPEITPANFAEFFGIGKKPSGEGFAVLSKGSNERTLTARRLEITAAEMRSAHDELFGLWSEHWVFPKMRRTFRRNSKAKASAQRGSPSKGSEGQ